MSIRRRTDQSEASTVVTTETGSENNREEDSKVLCLEMFFVFSEDLELVLKLLMVSRVNIDQ